MDSRTAADGAAVGCDQPGEMRNKNLVCMKWIVRHMLEDEHVHLLVGNRVDTELDRTAQIHLRAIYLRGSPRHHAPATLSREPRGR